MTLAIGRTLALLTVGAVALAAAACTHDRTMDDGKMMHKSSTMKPPRGDDKTSGDNPMMHE